MIDDKELVWDRLKHGMQSTVVVSFYGDGKATKFNSAWFSEKAKVLRITVDDVAQSNYRDYVMYRNDIIFKNPPANGFIVSVEVYD